MAAPQSLPPLPPLRIWLYCLLLSATMLALLLPLNLLVGRKTGEALAGEAQRYLSEPPIPGQVRVLGLGSSLLRAATPSAYYQHLQGVAWMRLSKNNSGLGHLQIVLQRLTLAPPGVLVIDTNLLLQSTTLVDELRETLATVPLNAGQAMMAQAGLRPSWSEQLLQRQQEAFSCQTVSQERLQQESALLLSAQKADLSAATVDPELRSTLLKLSQQGVRIVLLSLRRGAQFEHPLAAEKQAWLRRWQIALPPGPAIRYLASPDFNDANLYCDGRHMNEAGARRFAPWWRHQLEQMGQGN